MGSLMLLTTWICSCSEKTPKYISCIQNKPNVVSSPRVIISTETFLPEIIKKCSGQDIIRENMVQPKSIFILI